MRAARVGYGIGELEALLWYLVGAAISCVGDLGIAAADQSSATQQGASVCIHDAKIGADRLAIFGIDISVLRPVITEAKLVDDVRREDASVSSRDRARMVDIVAGGK